MFGVDASQVVEQTLEAPVRFAPTSKQFDGLLPSHQLLDHLAWKFFSFKNGRGFKSPTDVFQRSLHMGMASGTGSRIPGLMNDLERRLCNARATDEVAVLPGGGGRLVQLNCMYSVCVCKNDVMISQPSNNRYTSWSRTSFDARLQLPRCLKMFRVVRSHLLPCPILNLSRSSHHIISSHCSVLFALRGDDAGSLTW